MSKHLAPKKNTVAPTSYGELVDRFDKDPNIETYTLTVRKSDGFARVSAKTHDGLTQTRTILGVGLQQQITYNPTGATIENRDENIRTLRNNGITQVDIAEYLGISQSLVSKVLRRPNDE